MTSKSIVNRTFSGITRSLMRPMGMKLKVLKHVVYIVGLVLLSSNSILRYKIK